MERLLHYCWKHKIFPLTTLWTTDGQALEIIDVGLQNTDAGPDFFNAKVKIDDVLWIGNVEIHDRTSDWFLHGHDKDLCYDSVILHIAETVDVKIRRSNGELIPQLQMTCPDYVRNNYRELFDSDAYPPCYRIIPSLSDLFIHSWMAALQLERFEKKTEQLKERIDRCNGNWEDAFFITLSRNFGFGINGEAFETWANILPLRALDKHRDNLFQVEALFFGQAGILEETKGDAYYLHLKKEYDFLAYKFQLTPMNGNLWKFLRLRPANFPHVRIAQLACLYHRSYGLISQVTEADTLKKLRDLFRGGTSEYWVTHYTFGGSSPNCPKTLSDNSLNLIIINTIVTFLYAYGHHKSDENLCLRAGKLLEELPPEYNHITRMWEACGITATHAGDSQALIQLKKAYCDKKKCLFCRIGYEYLKRNSTTIPKKD
ncbi:DUF2851 family protein [Phocaeicola abscessus]|uniref:DUF2851 family protein n=1 Tax=Phocaeicola abscessus TaxID=555313 RepID=UPI0004BBFF4C|nr:DUF2851 family protein [Phocaeicola abscessus]